MAATRSYVRGSNGRFAGSGTKGAKVTTGRAGGFHNASFRQRVIAGRHGLSRAAGAKGHKSVPAKIRHIAGSKATKTAVKVAVGVGTAAVLGGGARRLLR